LKLRNQFWGLSRFSRTFLLSGASDSGLKLSCGIISINVFSLPKEEIYSEQALFFPPEYNIRFENCPAHIELHILFRAEVFLFYPA
jgi:hypothetical protein